MQRFIVLFLAFLLFAALALGQAQVGAGDLSGTVADQGGAVVKDARVTVTDDTRGVKRITESDETGAYRVSLLSPGVYRVRIEAEGFAATVVEGVEIRVGEILQLKSELTIGAVATEVTVNATIPVVETERTQLATTIDSQRLRGLPVNRRNYLDFSLLTPGVVETNDLVDGTDYRVAQTPHSGLSFGGSNGRGNAFTIDGAENTLNSGGVRPSVSQEVVQEFQVNQNSFLAEIGGASGGSLNIVTKSGSNERHGSVFGYYRGRNLEARNYFDGQKSDYSRGQFGATLGGPVKRDRTFYFVGFESLNSNGTVFVPILQDRGILSRLTSSQQDLVNFFKQSGSPQLASMAASLQGALTPSNYPKTMALLNSNSGSFPSGETSYQLSARVDHRLSDRNAAFIRVNATRSDNDNAQFGALVAYNRGRNIVERDGTAVAGNTYVINSRWLSVTRLMVGQTTFGVTPIDANGPEINIGGIGSFGREIFLPSQLRDRHYQGQETMSYNSGRHSVKFGLDINPVVDHVTSETFFSGRFSFGEAVPLANVINSAAKDPNAASNLVSTLSALGQQRLAANVMAPISALQAYNLGLPSFYQQGFGDPNWKGTSMRYGYFVQDSYRIRPNLILVAGMRYDLEVEPAVLPTDTNNITPRLGFAWTPMSDQKTVVRGGFGLFYAPVNAQVANLAATLNGKQIAQSFVVLSGTPGLINPKTGQLLTSADVYQTLAAQNVIGARPITRADLNQFNLKPGPNAPFNVLFQADPNFESSYAQHGSFEIEHAFGQFSVSAGYLFNRGTHLVRSLDENLYYNGRTALNQPVFGFYDPLIFQRNVLQSTANSFYHAGTLQVNKRFSGHFAVNGHYTFSRSIDEVTDFNSDFQPNDQLNARAERALSPFNQTHRVVASGLIESPFAARHNSGLVRALFGGFTFSPIVTASSGRPFNVLAGYDTLNDRHPTTHRPLDAGRNIGHGPAFFSVDMRLARRVALGEHTGVEFTADGFNLLNHTNFKSLNNTVGNLSLSQLPNPLVGHRGIATDPLAFTSAFDPRQFQLGLKLSF